MFEPGSLASALSILAASAAAPGASGQAIAEHGNNKGAPPCATCHGANFAGQPALKAPALAGLPAVFIVQRLDHYAGPSGKNPMMRQVATALDPAERQAVATYLASLPKSKAQAR